VGSIPNILYYMIFHIHLPVYYRYIYLLLYMVVNYHIVISHFNTVLPSVYHSFACYNNTISCMHNLFITFYLFLCTSFNIWFCYNVISHFNAVLPSYITVLLVIITPFLACTVFCITFYLMLRTSFII